MLEHPAESSAGDFGNADRFGGQVNERKPRL
jgi:hypothetical protein